MKENTCPLKTQLVCSRFVVSW